MNTIRKHWPENGSIVIYDHELPGATEMTERASKQINANVTPTMYDQLEEAMKNAGEASKSAAIREAIALYCEAHGVKGVDASVDERGGYRGNPNSLKNLGHE